MKKFKLLGVNSLMATLLFIGGLQSASAYILEVSFDRAASSGSNNAFSGSGLVTFDGSSGTVNITDLDLSGSAFGQSFDVFNITGSALLSLTGDVQSWGFAQNFQPIVGENWSTSALNNYPGPGPAIGITCDDRVTLCSVDDSSYGTSTNVTFNSHPAAVPEPLSALLLLASLLGLIFSRQAKAC